MEAKSDEYFFLSADCLFVTGAINAAIYQLSTGDVYSIDSVGREILEFSEQGLPISNVYPRVRKISDVAQIVNYLHKLRTWGLGHFSHEPVSPAQVDIPSTTTSLNKVWLELTNSCNLRCVHRYADSSPHRENGRLGLDQWRAVPSRWPSSPRKYGGEGYGKARAPPK